MNELTVTDYFAINIFSSLMNNSSANNVKHQVINKKELIKESYELAKYMTILKKENEQKIRS